MNDGTILVVDDEPQIRRVLRSTLSNSGYTVVEAKNGQQAIEMVMRERPDLILMDVNMPEMSGLETCSKIRLSYEGPIIMVTVRSSERDKVLALDAGADVATIDCHGPIRSHELCPRGTVVVHQIS